MCSKPSISEMANLAKINVIENIILPPTDKFTEEEIEKLLNADLGEELQDFSLFEPVTPEPACECTSYEIQPSTSCTHPGKSYESKPTTSYTHPGKSYEIQPSTTEKKENQPCSNLNQLILNDVEMNEITREENLGIERAISLSEIDEIQQDIERKLLDLKFQTVQCQELLKVLIKRKAAVNLHYDALIEQEKLMKHINS
jgi:hypothetical protein